MSRSVNRAVTGLSAGVVLLGGAAAAQVMSPMVYNGFIGGSAVAAAGRRGSAAGGSASSSPSAARSASLRGAAPPARTRYRRDPEISRQVAADFNVFLLRHTSPALARGLQTYFRQHDFVQVWSEAAASDGYHSGDAVDAIAAYWAVNWAIANAHETDPQTAAGVREQVRAHLPFNAEFRRLSEARKQTMAETYMIHTVYEQATYVAALKSGDKPMTQKVSDAVETRFMNETHTDLRRLALTPRGFVLIG